MQCYYQRQNLISCKLALISHRSWKLCGLTSLVTAWLTLATPENSQFILVLSTLWSILITLCPSSLSFSFKQHLILNHWINFNQTSLKWSFGGLFSKLFKDLNSMKNFGCCSIRMEGKWPILKFFSSESACWITIKFHRNVPLVTLYKSCSSYIDWLKNMTASQHQKRGKILL